MHNKRLTYNIKQAIYYFVKRVKSKQTNLCLLIPSYLLKPLNMLYYLLYNASVHISLPISSHVTFSVIIIETKKHQP